MMDVAEARSLAEQWLKGFSFEQPLVTGQTQAAVDPVRALNRWFRY